MCPWPRRRRRAALSKKTGRPVFYSSCRRLLPPPPRPPQPLPSLSPATQSPTAAGPPTRTRRRRPASPPPPRGGPVSAVLARARRPFALRRAYLVHNGVSIYVPPAEDFVHKQDFVEGMRETVSVGEEGRAASRRPRRRNNERGAPDLLFVHRLSARAAPCEARAAPHAAWAPCGAPRDHCLWFCGGDWGGRERPAPTPTRRFFFAAVPPQNPPQTYHSTPPTPRASSCPRPWTSCSA